MGSVQYPAKCPRCNKLGSFDYRYKSGELTCFWDQCECEDRIPYEEWSMDLTEEEDEMALQFNRSQVQSGELIEVPLKPMEGFIDDMFGDCSNKN